MSRSLRCFVAIDPPAEARRALRGATETRLSGVAGRVREDRLHLTLCFIGGVEEERLDALRVRLTEAASSLRAFELRLDCFGWFPDAGPARVAWAGARQTNPRLQESAEAVRAAVRRAGFSPDEKPFRAHVTLARFEDTSSSSRWQESVEAGENRPLDIAWNVTGIRLYESRSCEDGPAYESLSDHLFKIV